DPLAPGILITTSVVNEPDSTTMVINLQGPGWRQSARIVGPVIRVSPAWAFDPHRLDVSLGRTSRPSGGEDGDEGKLGLGRRSRDRDRRAQTIPSRSRRKRWDLRVSISAVGSSR